MGMVGAIIAMVIAGLIVYVIVFHGAGILGSIQQSVSGTVSLKEIAEHPQQYENKEVTVVGYIGYLAYSTTENKYSGMVYDWVEGSVMIENIPPNISISANVEYRVTGVLRFLEATPTGYHYLDYISVELA